MEWSGDGGDGAWEGRVAQVDRAEKCCFHMRYPALGLRARASLGWGFGD